MKRNLATYKIWAPDDALWTEWAKPVLFVRVPSRYNKDFTVPDIIWTSQVDFNTMVVIDLPEGEGVAEGMALARLGYRPVPLYNGVYGPNDMSMIVNVEDIVAALYRGADELTTLNIRSDAPPAFILDSNRMKGEEKHPGKYDNRWCVFPQDMPSASFLSKQGIHRVIVRSDKIQNDLSHILRRYQEQGIKVYQCNGTEPLKEVTVVKPSKFKSLFYRFKVISGLTRNGTGGFGGTIPEALQSTDRYYRSG